MSQAAWNKAFSQGSKALQDRLKKVHAKNPAFQSWLKSSGHGEGQSVKQASKEVKVSARAQELKKKSLKAYGATKGTRMGDVEGRGEMQHDTIAPLTKDQHSKVQAAARAAKAKKPLSKTERLSAIAAAVRKAQSKHDVATLDVNDDHDDLRDVHQSLHIKKGYNEEASPMIKPPRDHFDSLEDAKKHRNAHAPGKKIQKMEYIDSRSGRKFVSYKIKKEEVEMNEGKMKDIVTDREETARLAAQEKDLPFTPDKKVVRRGPGGPMSQAKWLAKQAMMKAMKKEETESVEEGSDYYSNPRYKAPKSLPLNTGRSKMITPETAPRRPDGTRNPMFPLPVKKKEVKEEMDLVSEQNDTTEKLEMAQTQLHFICYAANEILEFIKMNGEVEEWYQNKLSKVHSDMESLHSYVEGEMRRTGMKEEAEEVKEEKLDPVGKEDKDIDNDGDTDKTDVYLHKKRKAIRAAIKDKLAKKLGK